MPVNENDSYLRHAAVVIVGGARSLGWNMVCDPEQHVCCSESYGPNFLPGQMLFCMNLLEVLHILCSLSLRVFVGPF